MKKIQKLVFVGFFISGAVGDRGLAKAMPNAIEGRDEAIYTLRKRKYDSSGTE